MAKLVAAGRLTKEKFTASYIAWKNHISHGDCVSLATQTDNKIYKIIEGETK